MWPLAVLLVSVAFGGVSSINPNTGDELVTGIAKNCYDMQCVKEGVLRYLDNVLQLKKSDTARKQKNINAAIFNRIAKILKTQEIRYQLPLMDNTQIVYNPKTGIDVATFGDEARGLLKKKLLLPALLLLKLKLKALMPIFVAIIGLKALKALILSKIAILVVLGFVIYQLCTKAGMSMPMMMPATEPPPPPSSAYGAPAPSTMPPSSYEPGWEPSNPGGPYARVWSNSDAQSIAYSNYFPGTNGASTTTSRP